MTREPIRHTGDRGNEADHVSDEAEDSKFKPLTAQEAASWRKRQKPTSMMVPLLWQMALGALAVLVAWKGFASRPSIAMSVLYGVCAVWIPAGLFARAMARQQRKAGHALGALAALMLWEGIKIVLTIALLLAAPRVVKDLSWLALLIGFVVTVKAAWLGWWWQMRPARRGRDN